MTELLQQAFAAVSKLPTAEQDSIADWLLREMESDTNWDASFARSQDLLAHMAAEARAEHGRGETEDLDPDNL